MSRTRSTKNSPTSISIEGNKGGTYIRIEATDVDGIIILEVGDQCVVAVKPRRVRVTDLSRAIIDAQERGWLLERNAEGDVYDYMKEEVR